MKIEDVERIKQLMIGAGEGAILLLYYKDDEPTIIAVNRVHDVEIGAIVLKRNREPLPRISLKGLVQVVKFEMTTTIFISWFQTQPRNTSWTPSHKPGVFAFY